MLRCDKIVGDDGEIYTVFYEVDPLFGTMQRETIKKMEAEQRKRVKDAVNDINERR